MGSASSPPPVCGRRQWRSTTPPVRPPVTRNKNQEDERGVDRVVTGLYVPILVQVKHLHRVQQAFEHPHQHHPVVAATLCVDEDQQGRSIGRRFYRPPAEC